MPIPIEAVLAEQVGNRMSERIREAKYIFLLQSFGIDILPINDCLALLDDNILSILKELWNVNAGVSIAGNCLSTVD